MNYSQKDNIILNIAKIKRELLGSFAEKSQVIEFLCQELMNIAQTQPQSEQQSTEEWLEEWLATAICSE